jgi:uncharacterized protein DUF3106
MLACWFGATLLTAALGALGPSAAASQPGRPLVKAPGPATQPHQGRPLRRDRWSHRRGGSERQRRHWEKMSGPQRKEIRQIWEKLQHMPPEKRQRLINVLRQYHRWLRSLPPDQRKRVQKMPPQERLRYMQMFVKQRSPEQFSPVTPAKNGPAPHSPGSIDPKEHKRQFLRQLREFYAHLDEPTRQRLRGMPPHIQERELRRMFFRHHQGRRIRFFHRDLTEEQRHEVLRLHKRNPAEAERRFRQLWSKHHGHPTSRPTPKPPDHRREIPIANPHD